MSTVFVTVSLLPEVVSQTVFEREMGEVLRVMGLSTRTAEYAFLAHGPASATNSLEILVATELRYERLKHVLSARQISQRFSEVLILSGGSTLPVKATVQNTSRACEYSMSAEVIVDQKGLRKHGFSHRRTERSWS